MQPQVEAGRVDRMLPCAPGEEMKKSRTEREEVRPIAQMFDQNHFASSAEHAGELLKELHASFVMSKFVSGEDQECRVKVPVRGR